MTPKLDCKSLSLLHHFAKNSKTFCHHHKPKLQISLLSQKWHCWVCDKKGRSLYTLLKLIRAPKALIDEVRQYRPDYKVKKVKKGQDMRIESLIKDPKKTGNKDGA
mgnify:CR=1 FL=1